MKFIVLVREIFAKVKSGLQRIKSWLEFVLRTVDKIKFVDMKLKTKSHIENWIIRKLRKDNKKQTELE